MNRLLGKHALVTGGATGIGEAIVMSFLAEGARVVVASRDSERGRAFVGQLGAAAAWRTLDITDATAWSQLVDAFEGDPFNVLVNNAGGLIYPKQLHELGPDEWRREIDANLSGPFLGMHFVLPQMIRNGGGSIVNMGSISGRRGQDDAPGYQAAKGGLRILTKHVAVAYAPLGVRANCINPGAILTEAVLAEPNERTAPFVDRTPMKRPGSPWEVAMVAVFLASDESSFVTGADYNVDGGYMT